MGQTGLAGRSVAVRVIANMLIGGGTGGGDYNAPVGETRSFQIETPAKVVATWYLPIDNLPDLVKFQTISPTVSGDNRVTLTIKPVQTALLRILVFAEID
jgi:hypothetical protein